MVEGDALQINPEAMKYSTWASTIRKMKNAGDLEDHFRIERNGRDFYFVWRKQSSEPTKQPNNGRKQA
jgi:hypothetical protein